MFWNAYITGQTFSGLAPGATYTANATSGNDLSVACASATACTAAGGCADSSGIYQAVLITGSGNSWSAPGVALPANAAANSQTDLQAVACASAAACAAGGFYVDSANNEQGLLVTGSGSTWTATETPVPGNAGADPLAELFAVACPSTSACVAVGSYADASSYFRGLLLTGPG